MYSHDLKLTFLIKNISSSLVIQNELMIWPEAFTKAEVIFICSPLSEWLLHWQGPALKMHLLTQLLVQSQVKNSIATKIVFFWDPILNHINDVFHLPSIHIRKTFC